MSIVYLNASPVNNFLDFFKHANSTCINTCNSCYVIVFISQCSHVQVNNLYNFTKFRMSVLVGILTTHIKYHVL